jgi:hypothetical protein
MKNVRVILSVAAFMFAAAGAFVTSSSDASPFLVASDVTSLNAQNCPKLGTCSEIGTGDCQVGLQKYYKIIEDDDVFTCNLIAKGTFTPVQP